MTPELLAVALRLRPGAEAGQAARRRARQVAGPPGHQGRHRRRRPDGQPAGAAVRTPPRGAGRADRPRPGARRQGRGLRPRRDRQAARQGPDQPRQGQPATRRWSPARSTRATVFADADFVIEAVFEEMSVKKSVFADVEKVVSPECVLATNTSSLSITEMAADLEHPERVVGFHFFNPVAVMPLLEIVKGERDRRRHAGHGVRDRQGAEEDHASWSRTARRSSSTGCSAGSWARSAGSSTRAPRCRSPTAPFAGRRADAAVHRCCPWSVRRSRCTTTRRCTARSRTGSTSPPPSSGWWRRGRRRTTAPTARSTPRSRRCSRSRPTPVVLAAGRGPHPGARPASPTRRAGCSTRASSPRPRTSTWR